MTQMLEPQPGETIYDPTCGTGGMLISALAEVKRRGGEHAHPPPLRPGAQLMTSAIARMNLFLHGIEDFQIARGNTLSNPAFIEARPPAPFDVVLANPPYSIKKWNRERVAERPLGPQLPRHAAAGPRRLRLLPAHPEEPRPEDRPLRDPLPARRALPQRGGGDAAQARRVRPARVRARPRAEPLLQLADGSLRRHLPDAEARRARKGKVLFINAVHEVAREQAQSFLTPEHQERILAAYQAFADEPGFANGCDDRGRAREGRQPVDSALRPSDREQCEQATMATTSTRRGPRSMPAVGSSGRRWTHSWTCSIASLPTRHRCLRFSNGVDAGLRSAMS